MVWLYGLILHLFIREIVSQNGQSYVYSASCSNQSVSPRICPYTNFTQYLLAIKKGGTSILSTNPYDPNFFLCEQYNYDCGYVQTQYSSIQLSNGISLNMSVSDLTSILPSNSTLVDKIKPYLGLSGQKASCGMGIYPLVLSSNQSTLFFNNYMSNLSAKVTSQYTSQRTANSSAYSDFNMNIKTSVLQTVKVNPEWMSNSSQYWNYFIDNQFSNMSNFLKQQYIQRDELQLLHSAYLLQSVTAQCNRYQSVNFLVDQSGSITASKFTFAIQFLIDFVNQTNDDPTLMSINFFSTAFQQYINYGKNKATILSMLQAKTYPAGGTLTGSAINKTVLFIKGSNLPTGLPKILVILTDGGSYDDVVYASNYARDNGISIIAVGIGVNVNQAQLLQIAQTPSNIILVNSYSSLKQLVDYISNYMCKQTVTLNLNDTLQKNHLKMPSSPNYYRIKKDPINYLKLQIDYQTDPSLSQQQIYQSQIDPFPNQFTQYTNTVYRSNTLRKTVFIQPVNQASIRSKKNIYQLINASTSYISIGANQLIFNISLTSCASVNCTLQRQSAGMAVGVKMPVGIQYINDQNTLTQNQSPNIQIKIFCFVVALLFLIIFIVGICLIKKKSLFVDKNKKMQIKFEKTEARIQENLTIQQIKMQQNLGQQKIKQKQHFDNKIKTNGIEIEQQTSS